MSALATPAPNPSADPADGGHPADCRGCPDCQGIGLGGGIFGDPEFPHPHDLPADGGRAGAAERPARDFIALAGGYRLYYHPDQHPCRLEVVDADNLWRGYLTMGSTDGVKTLLQALVSAAAAGVPDGYVLVPREPTPEMAVAATAALPLEFGHFGNEARAVYKAMLAASPAAPVVADAKANPSPGADLGAVEALIEQLRREARTAPKGDRLARETLDAVRVLALPSAGAVGLISNLAASGEALGLASAAGDEAKRLKVAATRKDDIAALSAYIAALERGTGAGAVSAELRALSERATPGTYHHVLPFQVVPAQRTIHGSVPAERVDYVSTWPGMGTPPGHRVVIARDGSGVAPRSDDMAWLAAASNFARYRIAAEGRARPAGGEEA